MTEISFTTIYEGAALFLNSHYFSTGKHLGQAQESKYAIRPIGQITKHRNESEFSSLRTVIANVQKIVSNK